MLVFIRGFIQDVRNKLVEHINQTRTEIAAATQEVLKDVKQILYGNSSSDKVALRVGIDNAHGLKTFDSVGYSNPYCACSIIGKPEEVVKTHLVGDSTDPEFKFEGIIHGFAMGDTLDFVVWGSNELHHNHCLGRA